MSNEAANKIDSTLVAYSVVIVEDVPLMAHLLALHCQGIGLEVFCSCGTYAKGLAAIRNHRPQLLIADISLPDGDGLELAEVARREFPTMRILAISSYRDPWMMLRVQRSSVDDFIDKNEPSLEALSLSIRNIFNRRSGLSTVMLNTCDRLKRANTTFHRILSDHEIKVLSLIGECHSDEEAAVHLEISRWTVQSLRRDIMQKLGIHSTPKLIRYAILNGITRVDRWKIENTPSVTPPKTDFGEESRSVLAPG